MQICKRNSAKSNPNWARNNSTKINLNFCVRRPLGGVGVFHSKGWWPKSSCPPSEVSLPFRDAETTILIKFAFWRGLGRGKITENCPKTLFFMGNSMTIKFGNFGNFICQKFCCHLGGSHPWVSKRGIWDVPGILPGCPGPVAVFKTFVQKSSCAFFVPYPCDSAYPLEPPKPQKIQSSSKVTKK